MTGRQTHERTWPTLVKHVPWLCPRRWCSWWPWSAPWWRRPPRRRRKPEAQRVIFGSAGFTESNRFWTIARPEHLQYDPFIETLLDVDPKTGQFTPRLAEKWEASPDLKEWTFYLRKGVQFHYGFGEFTAKDVVHSHALMLRPDATATTARYGARSRR